MCCKPTVSYILYSYSCQFAQGEEWTRLCDELASKLLAAGNTLAATLCYICATNIDKTVEIWSHCLSAEAEEKPFVDRLQVSFIGFRKKFLIHARHVQ